MRQLGYLRIKRRQLGAGAFPAGTETAVNVTNANPDLGAPALVSISFSPASLDLSSTNKTVTVTAELSDTTSGVSGAEINFTSPSGNQSHSVTFDHFSMISGTNTDGVYQGTVAFDTCDQPGSWTLTASVTDNCQNTTSYGAGSGSVAFPNGTVTTLSVSNAGADTTPPQLASLTLSSTTEDITNGVILPVDGTAVASDNASGVLEGSTGAYISADGKRSVFVDFNTLNPIGGTALSGTFRVSATVNDCAETGTYTLPEFYGRR